MKKTRVCNVKVAYLRPEFDNLEEWTDVNEHEYIGRRGIVFITRDGVKERFPKKGSIWANPFKIGKDGTREEVLEKYEEYIRDKLDSDDRLVKKLLKLEGKVLGCWCYPEKCHGNVLIKLIKEYKE